MGASVLGMRGPELRAAFAKLRSFYASGDAEDDIAKKFGITWEDYEDLKKHFYEYEADDVRSRTPERSYIDYCIKQEQNIDDLTKMIAHFKEAKQNSAMVGAVKARADIQDRIIERGQDFGFIVKKQQPKLIAGVFVSEMSTKDIRSAIVQEMKSLGDLAELGDRNILDIDIGDVHSDSVSVIRALPAGPTMSSAGPPKKKVVSKTSNRVHGGRRRIIGGMEI